MRKTIPLIVFVLFLSLAILASLATKAHTAQSKYKNAVNYVTFGELLAESPFLLAFPDGSKIVTSYNPGINLGAESSVLEVKKS